MNKTLWIVIAILVVIGIAYYAMSGKSSTNTNNQTPTPSTAPTTTTPTTTPSPQPQASSQSLKDLITLGGSQKCQFSDAGSAGTFYVSSGKARGDFTTTADQKNVTSHMIMDGQTSYVWADGQNQGIKMAIDTASQNSAGAQGQGVDINKKIDYQCEAWAADSTMFTLPSGVVFMDIKAMMQNK